MRISDLLNTPKTSFDCIRDHCSNFLAEAGDLPLFKQLPVSYDDVKKVKVRFKKRTDELSESFDKAFTLNRIRERALFVSGNIFENDNLNETFYVFPTNGYKYMYNSTVTDSNEEYKQAFDTVLENIDGKEDEAGKLIVDLLQYSYVSDNLMEGIANGSEIIFYNIPSYYVVRESTIYYDDLLTILE